MLKTKKNRGGQHGGRRMVVGVTAVVTALCLTTGARALNNSEKFMKGASIGGIDVGGLTVKQAGKKMQDRFNSGSVTITAGNTKNTIKLTDIAKYDGEKTAQAALDSQNGAVKNLFPLVSGGTYDDAGFSLNREALSRKLSGMPFMRGRDAPRDAKVVWQNGKIRVIPEHNGHQYDVSKVISYVRGRLGDGAREITISGRSLMKKPKVTASDASIRAAEEAMSKIQNHRITLKGTTGSKDEQVHLDPSRFMKYVTSDDKGNLSVDEGWLGRYTASLNSNFATAGKKITFRGADGKKISVSGGTYGSAVDTSKETAQLKKDILSETDVERGVSMKTNGNDTLGKTYILLNIGRQHVTGYRDGKVVVSSDVVTGKDVPGRRTDRGAYYIFFKKSPDVLKGPNYATPVHVFAAFHNGQGFHDADSWRSAYGGSIYRTNGSHGCCNMPLKAARRLYHSFEIGTPVIII